jgi:hypothetical protein
MAQSDKKNPLDNFTGTSSGSSANNPEASNADRVIDKSADVLDKVGSNASATGKGFNAANKAASAAGEKVGGEAGKEAAEVGVAAGQTAAGIATLDAGGVAAGVAKLQKTKTGKIATKVWMVLQAFINPLSLILMAIILTVILVVTTSKSTFDVLGRNQNACLFASQCAVEQGDDVLDPGANGQDPDDFISGELRPEMLARMNAMIDANPKSGGKAFCELSWSVEKKMCSYLEQCPTVMTHVFGFSHYGSWTPKGGATGDGKNVVNLLKSAHGSDSDWKFGKGMPAPVGAIMSWPPTPHNSAGHTALYVGDDKMFSNDFAPAGGGNVGVVPIPKDMLGSVPEWVLPPADFDGGGNPD